MSSKLALALIALCFSLSVFADMTCTASCLQRDNTTSGYCEVYGSHSSIIVKASGRREAATLMKAQCPVGSIVNTFRSETIPFGDISCLRDVEFTTINNMKCRTEDDEPIQEGR